MTMSVSPHSSLEMDLFLIFCGCVISVYGFNFDTENALKIQLKNNSYFGYSVLLQKGTEPAVIIGAPRRNIGQSGGTVQYCPLTTTEIKCWEHNLPSALPKTPTSFNGNFFGSALDGGDNTGELLVACAPRLVEVLNDNYWLKGLCVSEKYSSYNRRTSSVVLNPLGKEPGISSILHTPAGAYYDNAFGETGLDLHYLQAENKVLLGAPGVKNWNGVFIVQSLSKLNDYTIIPQRTAPITPENYGYLGYKVTSARLESSRKRIWYVAGAPRGNYLHGNVRIYSSSGILLTQLDGSEMGSYFGSSILAVDLNNDHIDDLLVGAPMGAGSSWDEGYVYFYSYRQKFERPVKLTGSKKVGARFGTTMASLGDIDLDSYNDVAISAPYEDGGVGAVYIYKGSKSGINVIYSQRLSPETFSHDLVKGFGQGLSRGVDVDGNGHNDFAVGAYKSDHVFVIKSLSVIDYQLYLESNESSITTDVLNIQYCIQYTQRSKTNDVKNIPFKVELLLDYRTEGTRHFVETVNIALSKNYCKSLELKLMPSPSDISAFKIIMKSEIQRSKIIGVGESKIEKDIPYSHGCGDDNICQTQILVEALTKLQNIVLGLNKEMVVDVSADNVGEPGYGCKLNMNFSDALELRDIKDCILENSTYVCPFSTRIISRKETQFKFDIKLKNPELSKVTINFEVKCLGENTSPDTSKFELSLDVLLQNSPYIQGSSVPDNVYFSDENMKDIEVSHQFRIGNSGPSPIKLDVYVSLPTVKNDEVDIFVVEAKGSLNGIEVECFPSNHSTQEEEEEEEDMYDVQLVITESINRTIVIDCHQEGVECLRMFCGGSYLYKSTEIADYTVKVTIRTNILESNYRNELQNKGLLAYISTLSIYDSSKSRIQGHAATQIFASNSKSVPLWIYIVAIIIGVLLLALLIFLLYKCHFFDRNYRDKLNDEKLMEDHKTENDTDQWEQFPGQSESNPDQSEACPNP